MHNKSHTEESKRRMSIARKGQPGHFKGKHHSEETKQKMSEAKIGRGEWNKGLVRSEETRQKISKTSTGKPCPEERKKRISATMKGRPGRPGYWKGKHLPEETKQKSSQTKKRKMKEGLYPNNKFTRSKPEIELGIQLEKIFGINLQHSKRLDGRVFDYCYEPKKILIESDGTYWHATAKVKVIDQEKNEIAKNNNYTLIRYPLDKVNEVEPLIKAHYEELSQIFNTIIEI